MKIITACINELRAPLDIGVAIGRCPVHPKPVIRPVICAVYQAVLNGDVGIVGIDTMGTYGNLIVVVLAAYVVSYYNVVDVVMGSVYPAHAVVISGVVYNQDVVHLAGVADLMADTIFKAADDLGIKNLTAARTGTRYIIEGKLIEKELRIIASRLLVNPIIQHIVTSEPTSLPKSPAYSFKLKTLKLLGAGSNEISEMCSRFGTIRCSSAL